MGDCHPQEIPLLFLPEDLCEKEIDQSLLRNAYLYAGAWLNWLLLQLQTPLREVSEEAEIVQ